IGVQGAFDPDHRDGAAAEADTDDRQRSADAEAPRHEAETEAGHPRHEREGADRSEEHTSELQSLMRNSYAVFCLKKKNNTAQTSPHDTQTEPHKNMQLI